MSTFWVATGQEFTPGTTCADLVDSISESNLGPNVQTGDTIVRWLIQWYALTNLIDNSLVITGQPLPWVLGLWFTPNPDPVGPEFSATDLLEAEATDAIYTERTKWIPSRWTNPGFDATQWYASSPGVVDIRAKRTFHNHSTDRVHFGAQCERSNFSAGAFDVSISGWIWFKALIER